MCRVERTVRIEVPGLGQQTVRLVQLSFGGQLGVRDGIDLERAVMSAPRRVVPTLRRSQLPLEQRVTDALVTPRGMDAADELLIRDLTVGDVRAAVALATAAGFRDRTRFYDFVLRTPTCRPCRSTWPRFPGGIPRSTS